MHVTSDQPNPHRIRRLPDELTVCRLVDPALDPIGFPPLHPYVDRVWLALVGPTATVIFRRMGDAVRLNPGPWPMPTRQLATMIGVRNGERLAQSVGRMCRFGLAAYYPASGALHVRAAVAPVHRLALLRHCPALLVEHDRLLERNPHGAALVDLVEARWHDAMLVAQGGTR